MKSKVLRHVGAEKFDTAATDSARVKQHTLVSGNVCCAFDIFYRLEHLLRAVLLSASGVPGQGRRPWFLHGWGKEKLKSDRDRSTLINVRALRRVVACQSGMISGSVLEFCKYIASKQNKTKRAIRPAQQTGLVAELRLYFVRKMVL